MSRARRVQPAGALDRVAQARQRYQRTVELLDLARVELDEAIRAASAAGATIRPIAEAAGLSPERTRQIARGSE